MNKEALKVSYELFKSKGYNGTIDDYSVLMSGNKEALSVSYKLFSGGGYSGSIEDFSVLLGISEPVSEGSIDAEETALEQPSFEDQYAAMSETLMEQSVQEQAKMTPQGTGATAEEVQAPISPRMKQRQKELDMASKSEDGLLESAKEGEKYKFSMADVASAVQKTVNPNYDKTIFSEREDIKNKISTASEGEDTSYLESRLNDIDKKIIESGAKTPFSIVKEREREIDSILLEKEKEAYKRSQSIGMSPIDILNSDQDYLQLKREKEVNNSTVEYENELLRKISEGTNADVGAEDFAKAGARIFGRKDSDGEIIKINDKVSEQIIYNINHDNRLKGKILRGSASLREKEALINNAKSQVLLKSYKEAKDKAESIREIYQNKQSGLSNRIKKLTEERSALETEAIDVLNDENTSEDYKIKKLASLTDEYNSINSSIINTYRYVELNEEDLKTEAKSIQDEYDTVLGAIGFDKASMLFKNNFKKTDESQQFDELLSQDGFFSETGDALSTFVEQLSRTAFKSTFGFGADLIAGFGDMFTDQDQYSVYDAFSDAVNDFANFNIMPSSMAESTRIVDEEGNYNINYKTVSKTIGETIPFTLYLMNEVKKGKVSSLEKALGKMLNPTKSKEARAMINTVDAAARATFSDNVREGRNAGLDDDKARLFGGIMSLGEGMSELIMPETRYLNTIGGATLKRNFLSNLKSAAGKKAAMQTSKNFIENILKEGLEEEVVLALEDLTRYSMVVGHNKSILFDKKRQKELAAATIAMSGAIQLPRISSEFRQNKLEIYSQINENVSEVTEELNLLLKKAKTRQEKDGIRKSILFAQDISRAISRSPKNVNSNQIDLIVQKEKLLRQKENTDPAFHASINEKIAEIDGKIQEEAVKLNNERRNYSVINKAQLESKATQEELDEISRIDLEIDLFNDKKGRGYKQKVEDLENKKRDIIKEVLLRVKNIESKEDVVLQVENTSNFAKDLGELLGVNVFVLEDENQQMEGLDLSDEQRKKIKGVSGFYNKNIGVVINKSASNNNFSINIGAHEILHPLLFKKIGDAKAQGSLVKDLKKHLTRAQVNIIDKELSNRRYSKNEYALEFLNVLSDSIKYKKIKFDGSQRNIYDKIVDSIKKILNLNSKVKFDIGFENGGQVLEFLKKFTEDASTGKISDELSSAISSRVDVAEGELYEDTLLSNEQELEDIQQRYDSGEIDMEEYLDALDELDRKESRAKSQRQKKTDSKDFKSVLDSIGNNPNGFDFFDQRLEPALKKMVEIKARKFRTKSGDIVNLENLPGFNMEDFTSEVYFNMMRGKKNKDGSYGAGYIQKFDPSINDSLYGYINAQLGNRMNNVLAEGQMTQEKFSTQIQEETFGEIEEYAFDEAIDEQLNEQYKEERNLIDPTTIFEDADFYNEVTEEIESQFMDTMAADLIFKNTKNLAIKSLAKKLKVRESVIEKASQNLNTTELIDTAPIIASIADKAIKILPEGAILDKGDGLAISEKLIGTGTGLPRKILDAYYVKTKRLLSAQEGVGKKGVGLEPFIKRDISKAEFLKELGILEDGTHNPDIKPKTPESQTRRAFIDLLGKLMTNTRGRMMMANQGVPLSQINDFAAGKSEDMFSNEGLTVEELLNKMRIANADAKGLLEGISNSMKNPIIKKQLEDYGITQKQIKDLLKGYKTYATIKGKQIYSYEGLMNVIEMSNKFSSTLDPLLIETSSTSAKAYTGVYSKGFPSLESESSLLSGIKNQAIIIRRASGRIISPSAAIKMRNKYLNIGERLSRKPRNVKSKEASILRRESSSELLKRLKSELKKTGQSKIPDLSKLKSKLTGTPTNRPTYSQRKDLIEADANKNNLVRRYAREYLIAKLGDFIHEQGISKDERAARIAYMIHVLSVDSPSNSALKQLAEISKGYSLLSESTEFIQLEHLEATSKYNTEVFNAVMLNTLPVTTYEASFLDKRLSSKLDASVLKGGFGVQTALKEEKKDIIQGEEFAKTARDLNIEEDLFSKEAKISMMQNTMANILKKKTGIPVSEEMSRVTAKLNSDRRNKKFRFMSPSADDFVGFLYSFLGKGKEGDSQMKFFTEKLIDPLNKAYVAMAAARQKITRDFKDLNKEYEDVKVSLSKDSGYKKYTNDQVLRAYLYIKSGESNKVLNINETDAERFKQIVESNDRMMEYASYLTELVDNDGNWVSAKSQWQFGSIFEDVERIIDDVKRGQFMEEWNINAEAIFSENNMNKIESYYGSDFRNALEDMLYRIEKGKAIPEKTNKEMSEFQKWLTGSVAVTMFFNTRSAVLQLISTINYINWSDNNPIEAAKAFANIPQFAKDVVGIFNSDYLKERRGGLKTEVEAAVLANELRKGGVDGYRGFINKLLQKGFTFTQIGDSLAISFGGASFYRNRKNSYLKQGMSEQKAREQAWLDFIETTEQSQQSARPDKLSMQQTNSIGRVFLAFQNTPMQYYRLTTRAAQDLAAGRGDFKTNVSKIGYYSFVQGLIFSALQQSLFAFLGDAPDDEEKKEKFEAEREKRVIRTVNNTLDTMLRGSGLRGAYVATAKNAILEFVSQEKKGYKADHTRTLIEVLNLSAPVGIKARTLYQGAYMNYKYNRDIIEDMGFDIDNPGYDIVGSLLSAGVNIPMDKVINDIRQLKEAADSEHDAWQRVALALGWSTWNLGIENKKVRELSEKKTEEKKEAAKEKRRKESSGWGKKSSGWGKKKESGW